MLLRRRVSEHGIECTRSDIPVFFSYENIKGLSQTIESLVHFYAKPLSASVCALNWTDNSLYRPKRAETNRSAWEFFSVAALKILWSSPVELGSWDVVRLSNSTYMKVPERRYALLCVRSLSNSERLHAVREEVCFIWAAIGSLIGTAKTNLSDFTSPPLFQSFSPPAAMHWRCTKR